MKMTPQVLLEIAGLPVTEASVAALTVMESNRKRYTYQDTDLGTYITNPRGEILWIPEVSLQNQGFSQGDRRLPEVWQMNLEMADETGARIVKRKNARGEDGSNESMAEAAGKSVKEAAVKEANSAKRR